MYFYIFVTHRGSLYKYDDDCAFWNFALAANYAYNFYEFAIGPIKALQASYESEVNKKVAEMEKEALKVYSDMEKEDNSTSKHASKDAGKDEKDVSAVLLMLCPVQTPFAHRSNHSFIRPLVRSFLSLAHSLVYIYPSSHRHTRTQSHTQLHSHMHTHTHTHTRMHKYPSCSWSKH